MSGPVGVAVVGCGNVSHQYLPTLAGYPDDVRVVACADLDVTRAAEVAALYGVPLGTDVATAITHPDVELVVNLTVPAAHDLVAADVIAAGRHVYNEKPLALDRASGARMLDAAAAAGVRVGGAPDTFLAPGLRNALRAVNDGSIGTPQSALLIMQGPGPESWHPSPEFLYQRGAGPLLDIGPYYLTALTAAFGPATRVVALARQAFAERTVGSGPKAGTVFEVEVPTHVTALIEFAAGTIATLVMSFDSPLGRSGLLEITGTGATLALPDPNRHRDHGRMLRRGETTWTDLPGDDDPRIARGLGVAEMARAIRAGVPHAASGERALHVLDLMLSITESAERGEYVSVTSTFDPAAGAGH
ncbi:Gfo/Idh/MocA family protein [Catenuloplanes atrovinosus]|uniref:Dehydrogenase n=1 Tax=Catenuloplanes atrovinosus TaxID=137266 RepID=A0AAE3YKZ9_9ACTN|nr:Gfo/Idh/MocA family oxidoreductase [Catenuloplanes atrovinosus]MDR7275390.1 putative dehydrogenase [Catenuloplanes atrovinosus]